ncbi:glycosyltransferase [Nocardioides sp.]|uniref:glycosyltransferase n=1 Tax=Nocardioides sp. TaxID=35761 RepID=UPI003784F1F6
METLTLGLAQHTDPARVQFHFVLDSDSGYFPREALADAGAELVVVPPYQHPIAHRRALVEQFSQLRLDIVHAHTTTLVPFSLSAAERAGVPVRIAHAHTMAGTGEWGKNLMKYSLRPFAKRWATDLATSSLYAGDWLFGKDTTQHREVFYLPVARDLSAFEYDAVVRTRMRQELDLEDRFVVGHLGRFVAQKNHLFLLDCFKEVHAREPSAVLVLAGEGELHDEVERAAARLGVDGAVRFLGHRSDAPALYQAFDVFVLPSLYEGVPGTGVEAQAAGLPFVYSDTVTAEALLLPTARRLPLSAGPGAWAEQVLSYRQGSRTEDAIAQLDAKGFGIVGAAERLSEYYEGLVRRNGAG